MLAILLTQFEVAVKWIIFENDLTQFTFRRPRFRENNQNKCSVARANCRSLTRDYIFIRSLLCALLLRYIRGTINCQHSDFTVKKIDARRHV